MTVLPALMLVDGNLNRIAEFTFGDLDSSLFAWCGVATGAIIRRRFWSTFSYVRMNRTCS